MTKSSGKTALRVFDSAAEAQLGKKLRVRSSAAATCALGLPVVVRVPPLLPNGEPFPTLYWLTCPLAARRIGRLEAAGGVRAFEEKRIADAEFAAALREAHELYRAERDADVPADAPLKPRGGVAGMEESAGIKCLHTHFAHHAAGGPNPVGAEVAQQVGELNCVAGCVSATAGGYCRNESWREP